jgi:hypothetical protein
MTKFINDYENECVSCPQTIRRSRSDFSIFIEYAQKFYTKSDEYRISFFTLQQSIPGSFLDTQIMEPYFNPRLGPKLVARRIYAILLITAIVVIYLLSVLISCCCCKKKDAAKTSEAAPTKNSQRQKIE